MTALRPNGLWNWGIDTGKHAMYVVAQRGTEHAACTIKVNPTVNVDSFSLRHTLHCEIVGELHDFAERHLPIITVIEQPIGAHRTVELAASYGVIGNAVFDTLQGVAGRQPLILPISSGTWKKAVLGDGHGSEKAKYYVGRAQTEFPDSNIKPLMEDENVCAAMWMAEYAARIGIQ